LTTNGAVATGAGQFRTWATISGFNPPALTRGMAVGSGPRRNSCCSAKQLYHISQQRHLGIAIPPGKRGI
jgi:hypothetical protein